MIPLITEPPLFFTLLRSTTYDDTLESWWDTPIWRRTRGTRNGSWVWSLQAEEGELLFLSQGRSPPVGGATHQLLVANCQIRDFAPADRHHIEAALGLPAKHPQRVCPAAVETGAVRTEAYTPENTGQRSGEGSEVRGHTPAAWHAPCFTHLTGVVFPSIEPIMVNFSRSHSLTVLQHKNTHTHTQMNQNTNKLKLINLD